MKKLLSLVSPSQETADTLDALRKDYTISFLRYENPDLYVRLGVGYMKGDTAAIQHSVCKLESILNGKYDALLIGPKFTPLASAILMKEFSMGSWPKGTWFKLIYLGITFHKKPFLTELALRTEYFDSGELTRYAAMKIDDES